MERAGAARTHKLKATSLIKLDFFSSYKLSAEIQQEKSNTLRDDTALKEKSGNY